MDRPVSLFKSQEVAGCWAPKTRYVRMCVLHGLALLSVCLSVGRCFVLRALVPVRLYRLPHPFLSFPSLHLLSLPCLLLPLPIARVHSPILPLPLQDRNAVLEWSARVTLRASSNSMCSATAMGRSCSNPGCGAPPGHGGFRRSSSGPSAYSPSVLGTSLHVPGDVVLLSVCGNLPTHLAQLIPPELPVADVRLRKDIPVTVTKVGLRRVWCVVAAGL